MKINYGFFMILSLFLYVGSANAYDLREYPSPFIEDGKFNGVIVVGDKAPAEDITTLSDIVLSLHYPILGSDPQSVSALDTLIENQTKTYTISGMDYEVTLSFVNEDSAQFIVNGQTTAILPLGEGDMLADGRVITLADIFFEDNRYSATFFFGWKRIKAEKIMVGAGGAKLASEVDNIQSTNSILVGHACDNPLIMKARQSKGNCDSGYERGIGSLEAFEFPNGKVSIVVTGHSPEDISNAAKILRFYGYYRPSLRGSKVTVVNQNNELVVTTHPENKKVFKPTNLSTKSDFSEYYYKIEILIVVLLVLALIFLILKKKPKGKQRKTKV